MRNEQAATVRAQSTADHVKVDMLARDLVRLLQDLLGLHTELADHLRDKLEAVRRADADRIQSITAREVALAKRGAEREGLRRQLTRRLVEALCLEDGRAATVRERSGAGAETSRIKLATLAEHLPEPRRSQLLGVAAGLRSVLEEIERLRVVDRQVTEEMLKHLSDVFAVITGGGMAADTYSRKGVREGPRGANVFEAVG